MGTHAIDVVQYGRREPPEEAEGRCVGSFGSEFRNASRVHKRRFDALSGKQRLSSENTPRQAFLELFYPPVNPFRKPATPIRNMTFLRPDTFAFYVLAVGSIKRKIHSIKKIKFGRSRNTCNQQTCCCKYRRMETRELCFDSLFVDCLVNQLYVICCDLIG